MARLAIADADSRSTSSSGRFSDFTLRAGAVRAVARVVATGDRDVLASAVDAALDRARGHYLIDLAADTIDVPGGVGRYMLAETATLKRDVEEGMKAQAKRGKNVDSRRGEGPAVTDIDDLQVLVNKARADERDATKASVPGLRKLDVIHAERITRSKLLDSDTVARLVHRSSAPVRPKLPCLLLMLVAQGRLELDRRCRFPPADRLRRRDKLHTATRCPTTDRRFGLGSNRGCWSQRDLQAYLEFALFLLINSH